MLSGLLGLFGSRLLHLSGVVQCLAPFPTMQSDEQGGFLEVPPFSSLGVGNMNTSWAGRWVFFWAPAAPWPNRWFRGPCWQSQVLLDLPVVHGSRVQGVITVGPVSLWTLLGTFAWGSLD